MTLPAYSLLLAPMAGCTDAPMRALCRAMGADFTVTEMVSAAALCFGDKKTAPLAAITSADAPTAVQLFGHDIHQMERAAGMIASGEYAHACTEVPPAAIDINMGCPVKKIISGGDGSALMRTPSLCAALVEAARRGAEPYGIPVTVKIRAGWDAASINAPEVARLCAEAGAAMICVHGRTRAQMYAPSADWSVIRAVREAVPSSVPVIGNGDIVTAADALRMRAETGCDGVAIGRAAMGDPWLFRAIRAAETGDAFTPPAEEERRRAAADLARAVIAWVTEHGGNERQAVHECRGRCAHFIRDSRGSAALRAKIHAAESEAELVGVLMEG